MSADQARAMFTDTASLTVNAGTAGIFPLASTFKHEGIPFFLARGPYGLVRSSLVIRAISSSTPVIPPVAGGGWVATVELDGGLVAEVAVLAGAVVVVVGFAVVVVLLGPVVATEPDDGDITVGGGEGLTVCAAVDADCAGTVTTALVVVEA